MQRYVLSGALGLMIACAGSSSAPPSTATPAASPAPKSGIDLSAIDDQVRPQDDFFRYVNGGWIDRTEIPADKARIVSFTELAEAAEANIRVIVDELRAGTPVANSEAQKLKDLYESFMDEAAVNARGMDPVRPLLAQIDGLRNKRQMVRFVGELGVLGVNPLLGVSVSQDMKNSTEYILYLSQSGLGLPDRDYYLEKGDSFQKARDAYRDYLKFLYAQAETKAPGKAAQQCFAFEKALAKIQWSRVDNRDRDKTYNKFVPRKLSRLSNRFAWADFFEANGTGVPDSLIVQQPSYVRGLSKLLKKTPLATWKIYLKARVLDSFAPFLNAEVAAASFAFHGRALAGIPENKPRWKRGISLLDAHLGEALGKLYVKKHFQEEAKVRMTELVENLRRAFEQSIDQLDWMTDATKAAAKKKLAKFHAKIGYPDEWRDYTALEIKPGALVENVIRARRFGHHREMNKLGKPIDRNEWFMRPHTVNAYYHPTMNEIVFPAAILQPPFFQMDADDAVNYGAIGAVIGHELSHGFDDQGRKSDGDGNLNDWWTADDAREFSARANRLAAQYAQYEPLPGHKLNGKLTLGENIGDLGGLTVAYRAYQLSLGGQPAPKIDGFNGPQRFFMGWAQVWRAKVRDAEALRRIRIDPHSPPRFRVHGVLTNMPEFHAAFSLKPSDALFTAPDKRVKIW